MAKTKKAKNDVAEETDTPIVTEIREADADGNRFLTGMEQEVKYIPELREAVKKEKLELVPPFQAAQKALSAHQTATKALIEAHKQFFERDEDKGTLTYDDGEVKIVVQEKDAISYEVKKDEA